MRLLPCGEDAILVELDNADQRRRLDDMLGREPMSGVWAHVPADRTVLVRADPPRIAAVAQALAGLESLVAGDEVGGRAGGGGVEVVPDPDPVVIPVTYDGPDLGEVADLLGVTADEVIARHTGQLWRVEFSGFAPGFGYLVGRTGGLEVPRRDTPRTRIPAGSVGLAGPYSGVYPSASPGGWQLIGRTEVPMWRPEHEQPALVRPGDWVAFEVAGS